MCSCQIRFVFSIRDLKSVIADEGMACFTRGVGVCILVYTVFDVDVDRAKEDTENRGERNSASIPVAPLNLLIANKGRRR